MKIDRRRLLAGAGMLAFHIPARDALAAPLADVPCYLHTDEVTAESVDSPFYEHFHQLTIPLSALLNPPAQGVTIRSSPVDQGSYDVEAFEKFILESHADEKALQRHQHDVLITEDQLRRLAGGQPAVEIRVISKNGNYVHNFLITAPQSALVKVRKVQQAAKAQK